MVTAWCGSRPVACGTTTPAIVAATSPARGARSMACPRVPPPGSRAAGEER